MRRHLISAMFILVACEAGVARAQDALPSWNDGPSKNTIVSFVEKVTKDSPTTAPRISANSTKLWMKHRVRDGRS